MHVRFLVEDPSGKIMLTHLVPKIIDTTVHTVEILAWHGIGRLPTNLLADADPQKRTLLDKLPSLLRAAGKQFMNYDAAVVVVVDLDRNDREDFLRELDAVLDACTPRPKALFRLAIEEGEAWLLGDRAAIKAAYTAADDAVLNRYTQDSICGTWETLADAIHPKGRAALDKAKVPYSVIGTAKCNWADRIAPAMDPARNVSPSFQEFLAGVQSLLPAA